MLVLPIKRDHRLLNQTTLIDGLTSAQVSEIIQHLLAYISACAQQGAIPLKNLEISL